MRRAPWSRSAPACIVLALIACACARTTPTAPPAARVLPGSATSAPDTPANASSSPASPPAATADGTGIVQITVQDAAGTTRSQIPIVLRALPSGPERRVVTGARGTASLTVPAGRYRIQIPTGCAEAMEIFKATSPGTLGVSEGRTAVLTMVVEARRRFWAGTPVTWQPEVPWPRNADVRFRFSVYDRCRDRLAENTSIAGLRYLPSTGLTVVKPAFVSDGDAYITLTVRCTAAGDPTLMLSDPEDATESVDLISLKPSFDPNARRCA